MFHDARSLPAGAVPEGDLCIIGVGAARIAPAYAPRPARRGGVANPALIIAAKAQRHGETLAREPG